MSTSVRITADFDGYPSGRAKRRFRKGDVVTDVSVSYAELLIKKGLARPEPATDTPTPKASKKDDAK